MTKQSFSVNKKVLQLNTPIWVPNVYNLPVSQLTIEIKWLACQ